MKIFTTYPQERGKHKVNPGLLWEYRMDTFDWQKSCLLVVERVVSMGALGGLVWCL